VVRFKFVFFSAQSTLTEAENVKISFHDEDADDWSGLGARAPVRIPSHVAVFITNAPSDRR
jgi:hypothetical protein